MTPSALDDIAVGCSLSQGLRMDSGRFPRPSRCFQGTSDAFQGFREAFKGFKGPSGCVNSKPLDTRLATAGMRLKTLEKRLKTFRMRLNNLEQRLKNLRRPLDIVSFQEYSRETRELGFRRGLFMRLQSMMSVGWVFSCDGNHD